MRKETERERKRDKNYAFLFYFASSFDFDFLGQAMTYFGVDLALRSDENLKCQFRVMTF